MLRRFNFVAGVNDSFHQINFKPALKVLSLYRFPNLPLSPSYLKEIFCKKARDVATIYFGNLEMPRCFVATDSQPKIFTNSGKSAEIFTAS